MKTALIILLAIFLGNSLYANELEWVDEQIEAIKPPRKGVNIPALGSPFVFLDKNKPETKDARKGSRTAAAPASKAASSKTASLAQAEKTDDVPKKGSLVLSTIINSSAMIDGSWYKVSDKISSYTVTDITKTSVTLKQGSKELVLSTVSKNPNLKFKNK
ncbi:MAG: hypothetical protein RQ763_10605 [Sulfurimonas sp.]|uniref:hypothetical protein n=1 Tax=Sulfurimonas sp. TaxID=2022749 RepID=UPI0028CC37C1|nr:hypothetical protein [Sulfurimonas sp.]MDT8339631.1 hypothetical protein [Sulfurimonas sp.]